MYTIDALEIKKRKKISWPSYLHPFIFIALAWLRPVKNGPKVTAQSQEHKKSNIGWRRMKAKNQTHGFRVK